MDSLISADVAVDAGVRLFCVPYAGAGASLYRSWSPIMPSSIQICPVQMPGREEKLGEQCMTSIDVLVGSLMEALPPYLDRPYAFFGHSMGAKIVFELCRATLQAGYAPPEFLAVSACRAPHMPEPAPIHNLPEEDFLDGLKRYSADVTFLRENAELLEILMPLLRSDFLMDETYVFHGERALPVHVEAFYGTDDTEATLAEVSEWKSYTSESFSLTAVDGGHLFIRDKKIDIINVIISRLRKTISEC